MIASLLGVDAERRRAERASRLMRGSVAIVIEDMLGYMSSLGGMFHCRGSRTAAGLPC